MYLFVKLELILVAITNKETNNFTLYLRHHRHLINNNTTRKINVRTLVQDKSKIQLHINCDTTYHHRRHRHHHRHHHPCLPSSFSSPPNNLCILVPLSSIPS